MTGADDVVVVSNGIVVSATVVSVADSESEPLDVTTARTPLTSEMIKSDHCSRPRRNINRMLDALAHQDAGNARAIESSNQPTRQVANKCKANVPPEQIGRIPQGEERQCQDLT